MMMDQAAILEQARCIAPTYARPERVFVRGDGAYLEDAAGERYLDMTSGIAVTALGHGSPVVTRALREAAEGLVHVSNLFHTAPAAALAHELVRLSFADQVFFTNSGAEAVEGALKFARLHAGQTAHNGAGRRRGLVAFSGGFHGRTFGALSATDRPDYREPFEPLVPDVTLLPFNDPRALARIDRQTAAAIVEPIQGEGGIRVAEPGWIRQLRSRCDEVGALLIFDEVQCGLGRTGRLWAHELYDVRPDLMTLAKPLAGGLPMGAVLMTREVAACIRPGCHGTTFGGGPLVAHVARAVLETLSDAAFLEDVRRRGALLLDALQPVRAASPLVEEVRGVGLFLGLRLAAPPADVVAAALEEGLLLVPAGEQVVRLLPPLTAGEPELLRAVELLQSALRRVERARDAEATPGHQGDAETSTRS